MYHLQTAQLLPGSPGNFFESILGQNIPIPVFGFNMTFGIPTPLSPLFVTPNNTANKEKSILSNIMAPVPRNAQAAAGAAQGVVASSLLLASGVCFTVAGGLGTGYAGMSEVLGLVNGAAARVNLGLEYAKTGVVRSMPSKPFVKM